MLGDKEAVNKDMYGKLVKKVNVIQAVDPNNLVKKLWDYETKISEIEKKILGHDYPKYIITQEFNNSTVDNFVLRLAPAKLATKDDIADFFKKDIS